MEEVYYLNGQYVKKSEAKISVFDLGFLRGCGIFDFFKTVKRKPFLLAEHLKRFRQSAKDAGLKLPADIFLKNIIQQILNKNKHLRELAVRLILTGGESYDTLTPNEPFLIMMVLPLKTTPAEYYERGVKLMIFSGERKNPSVKNLDYFETVKGFKKARNQGAFEILYVSNKGEVLECGISNFFAVKNNEIITAPVGRVLAGVTRNKIISLAKKLEIKVEERVIREKELKEIQEAFISSTTPNLLPVTRINNGKVGDGQVGPATKKLMGAFNQLIDSY